MSIKYFNCIKLYLYFVKKKLLSHISLIIIMTGYNFPRCYYCKSMIMFEEQDGTVVRVLTSHPCGLGLTLIPARFHKLWGQVCCWFLPCSEGFSKFQFNQDRGPAWKSDKADVASLVIYFYFFYFWTTIINGYALWGLPVCEFQQFSLRGQQEGMTVKCTDLNRKPAEKCS